MTDVVDSLARQRIATDFDAQLFVEAGAGTGKTTVLVERIVGLVSSGRASIEQIAAITFTEAAAAELKERIREQLELAALEDGATAGRCREALNGIDRAFISTIHGFANRVLQRHALRAGLPAIFSVMDGAEASIAFDQRWDGYVGRAVDGIEDGDSAQGQAISAAVVLGMTLYQLRDLSRELHRHWDRLDGIDIETPAITADCGPMISELEAVLRMTEGAPAVDDTMTKFLINDLAPWLRRLCNADPNDHVPLMHVLAAAPDIGKERGSKAKWNAHVDQLLSLRSALADAGATVEAVLTMIRRSVLVSLRSLVVQFVREYAEERQQNGTLEFHDLLVFTNRVLANDSEVRRLMQDDIRFVLVDEFQDTDPLQVTIVDALCEGPNAPQPFFVGDPKQSIYRFRRADVSLYLDRRNQSPEVVQLSQNFRSTRPILESVNAVFESLFAEAGQAPWLALPPDQNINTGEGTVRFIGSPDEDRDRSIADVRIKEADEVAALIDNSVTNLSVRTSAGPRPLLRRDIAVLLPTRTSLPALTAALDRRAIPYRVESRSLLWATQQVRDVLSVLRAIDDPSNGVAVVASLRTPGFGCSDVELLAFKQAGGVWDYRAEVPEVAAESTIANAYVALRELHAQRWWVDLQTLFEHVMTATNAYELGFAYDRPRETWNRLRFLADQLRAYVDGDNASLRGFIDWAERQREERASAVETVVPEADDDAVRITTIHAAKGLEYPMVIVSGLNSTGAPPPSARVLWDESGRPGIRLGKKDVGWETAGFTQLATDDEAAEWQEQARLLYVAATRARDHLVVSLHHKAKLDTPAARLWNVISWDADGLAKHLTTTPPLQVALDLPSSPVNVGVPSLNFDDWQQRREVLLKRANRRATISPTTTVEAIEVDANVEAMRFGSAVHGVLERLNFEAASDQLPSLVEWAADHYPGVDGAGVERMVQLALTSDTLQRAAARKHWREMGLSGLVDGVIVQGVIDLLYRDDDGLVIVDYKTGSPDPEFEEKYRRQLSVYAALLRDRLGEPVARAELLYLEGDVPLTVSVDLTNASADLTALAALAQ